jgi:hypothetical protein
MPCDLNQQQKRRDARRDSVARAVAWRSGRRPLLDRVLGRRAPVGELAAEDLRHREGEDVFRAFRI